MFIEVGLFVLGYRFGLGSLEIVDFPLLLAFDALSDEKISKRATSLGPCLISSLGKI
jgi:hypothetical protein